jgi:hypothetical protein
VGDSPVQVAHRARVDRGLAPFTWTTATGYRVGLTAAVAWRSAATVLAHDADLDRVARVIGIELTQPGEARPTDRAGPALSWTNLVGGTGIEPVTSTVSGKSGLLLAVA